MKTKVVVATFATILSMAIIISCAKRNPIAPQPQDSPPLHRVANHEFVTINNNILEFDSIASYLRVVDEWSESDRQDLIDSLIIVPTYNSLYSNLDIERDDSGFGDMDLDTVYKDDFMKAILNNDLIVKIGQYFIKVDEYNDRVLVLPDSYSDEFSDLTGNDLSNTHIQQFLLDDDVLSFLQGGEKKINCESGIGGFVSPQKYVDFVSGNYTYRIRGMMDYNRYGIYFTIKFSWTCRDKNYDDNHGNFDTRLCYSYLKYKKKCGATSGPMSASGVGSSMGNNWSKTWHSYEGSTPLSVLCTKFWFNRASDPGVKTDEIWIQKNCNF
jgi:hypothetical protein